MQRWIKIVRNSYLCIVWEQKMSAVNSLLFLIALPNYHSSWPFNDLIFIHTWLRELANGVGFCNSIFSRDRRWLFRIGVSGSKIKVQVTTPYPSTYSQVVFSMVTSSCWCMLHASLWKQQTLVECLPPTCLICIAVIIYAVHSMLAFLAPPSLQRSRLRQVSQLSFTLQITTPFATQTRSCFVVLCERS